MRDGDGVILLDMGGPETLDAVEPFLLELFQDPRILDFPLAGLFRPFLARRIASRRVPEAVRRYGVIGGGSPVVAQTREMAEALSAALGLPATFAMRYGPPRVADALNEIQRAGARRLAAIPLYPQRCGATTDSSLADLESRASGRFEIRPVANFHDHPGWIEALGERLSVALAEAGALGKRHVIFAAHSVPLRLVRKGDPYVHQVFRTAELVAGAVGLEEGGWTAAFQSRIGPVRWQGPQLEEVLETLRSEGVDSLVVQPVSFVSENLETLYDLDVDFREAAHAAGIRLYHRVPAAWGSPKFAGVLADLAAGALADEAT